MDKKEKYTGPTPEEMDRVARMMEANIPPGSSSKLRNINPMPSKEEADKERMEMEKALLKGAKEGMGGKKLEKAMSKKKGGAVKKMAKGGMVKSSASKRADGIAVKGKTRGKIC
jgi:hypothetical protein